MLTSILKVLFCALALSLLPVVLRAQEELPDGCTTITVGKAASADGSVITSHTLDDHRSRTTINIEPPREHKAKSTVPMFKLGNADSGAMPAYKQIRSGRSRKSRTPAGTSTRHCRA